MNAIINGWNNFVEKHPAASKWIREGGLFVIVSNVITVFKYLILQFLPKMLTNLPDRDFGWPGINMTLFGETFKWNILDYDQTHGGLRYFVAYMIAMVIGEAVNFPIQRSLVFRSKGNIWYQILWYVIAFVLITIVCSFLMGLYVPLCKQFFSPAVYNVLITVINGGVQMVIYFPIYKIIFPEGEAK